MPTTTIYDSFPLSGMPVVGDTLRATGDGQANQYFGAIIEPLSVTHALSGRVMIGDTIDIGGTSWTIQDTMYFRANSWQLSQSPATEVTGFLLPLTDADGNTRVLAVIEDETGRLPIPSNPDADIETYRLKILSLETYPYMPTSWVDSDDGNQMKAALCFATGTMIDTAAGPWPVQMLRVGDLVRTRDHGFQPLRWLGGRLLSGADLARAPKQAPIRIAAGALGPGQPGRDLTLSPQHRVLVRSPIAARMAGVPEVLVAAVHLLDLPGVERVEGTGGVGYWHLMFDAHEIVFANGAEAESLYLGPMAIEAMSADAMDEIAALFPELIAGLRAGGMPLAPARLFMRGPQTRKLVERQVKNRKPLVAPLPLGSRLITAQPDSD